MITDIQEIEKMVNKMEDTGEEVKTVLRNDKHFILLSLEYINTLKIYINILVFSGSSSTDSSSTLSGGDQPPAFQKQYSREYAPNERMERRPKSPPRMTRGSSPPSITMSSAPAAPPPPPPMMAPPPQMKASPMDQLMAHKGTHLMICRSFT